MANLIEHAEHVAREYMGTDTMPYENFLKVLALPAYTRTSRRLREKEQAGEAVNGAQKLAALLIAGGLDTGTLLVPALLAIANPGLGAATFLTRLLTYNTAVHAVFEPTERRR